MRSPPIIGSARARACFRTNPREGAGARSALEAIHQPMATQQTVADAPNIWAVAQEQFDHAAEQLDLDPGMRKVLRVPKRELTVNFPVTMDDGT